MKLKILLLILGVTAFSSIALAGGIYVLFNDSAIKDQNGSVQSDGNYHEYLPRLEFFANSAPDPTVSTGRLASGGTYSHVSGQHKYMLPGMNGGTLIVRIWKNAPSGNRLGNYYGKTSHGAASGTTLPYDWTIADLKTEYKADVPYKPAIGSISEALQRVGNSLKLNLGVPISYNESGADGKREVTGLSLAITYPSGKQETLSGQSASLSNTEAGTYKFKPAATNWYGTTYGDEISYTTLGGGAGGAASFIFTLNPSIADKLIINSIAVPSVSLAQGPATKASELAAIINTKAEEKVVAAVYRWDKTTGNPVGVAFDASGNIMSGGEDFNLVPGEGIQVYTIKEVKDLVLQGQ